MSERKTSEIKLRVTPSFKAAVQLAAEQAGETMSVYIETASQDRIDEEKAVTQPVVKRAGWTFPTYTSETIVATTWAGTELPTPSNPPLTPESINRPVSLVPITTGAADPKGLGTLGDIEFVPACEKNCHPWEWCECKQLRRD